jgi:hypothetical protein
VDGFYAARATTNGGASLDGFVTALHTPGELRRVEFLDPLYRFGCFWQNIGRHASPVILSFLHSTFRQLPPAVKNIRDDDLVALY